MTESGALEAVAHNLRVALGLAIFVEFSFVAALLAVGGAFNGGQPTTTPPFAVGYLVAGLVINVAVIVRTSQMLQMAQRGDRAALASSHISLWAIVALLFSAILPSIYLNAAVAALRG